MLLNTFLFISGIFMFVFFFLKEQKASMKKEILEVIQSRMGTIFPPRSCPTEEEQSSYDKLTKTEVIFKKIALSCVLVFLITFVVKLSV